jgi:hypothetical protein
VPDTGAVTTLDARAVQPLAWATMVMGRAQVAASVWSRDLGPNPAQYCVLFFDFPFSSKISRIYL